MIRRQANTDDII